MPKKQTQTNNKNSKKSGTGKGPVFSNSKFRAKGNRLINKTNIIKNKKPTLRENFFKRMKSGYDQNQEQYWESKTQFFKQNKKTGFQDMVNLENEKLLVRDSKKKEHLEFIEKGKMDLVSGDARVFCQPGATPQNFQEFCNFLKTNGYEEDGVSIDKDPCVKAMFNLLTIDNDGGYSDFVRQAKLYPGDSENAQLAYKKYLITACLNIADINLGKVNGNPALTASRDFLKRTKELLMARYEAKFLYDCAHDYRIIKKREIDANNNEVVAELKREQDRRENSLKNGERAGIGELPKTDVFLSDFVDFITAVNDSNIYNDVVSLKEVKDKYVTMSETQRMNYFLELTARYPYAWEYQPDVLKKIPEGIQACGNPAEVGKYYFENRRNMDGMVKAYLLRRIHTLNVAKKYNELNEENQLPKREAGDVANNGRLYQKNENGDVSIVAPLPGRQSSGNGCWSCSIQMMLRCHGIEVSQEAIRAFRPDYPEAERNDVAKEYALDEPKSILDFTDSALAFAPDKMVRSFEIFRPEEAQNYVGTGEKIDENEYLNKATKAAAKKIRRILNEDKCAVAFSDGSHYYSILDIKGDWLICFDSKTGKTENVHLRTAISEVFNGKNTGYAGNIHFAWISDIELAENGKDFLNVPSHYLQMNEDGSLITPPKEVTDDADLNRTKYQKMGMHVRLLGKKDNTAFDRLTESPLEDGLLIAEQAYLPKELNPVTLKRKMQERDQARTDALKESGKELLGENFQKKDYPEATRNDRLKAVNDSQGVILNTSTVVNFKDANGLYHLSPDEQNELWNKPGAIIAFRLEKSFRAYKELCEYMAENDPNDLAKNQWMSDLVNVQELYDKLMSKLNSPENAFDEGINKPEGYKLNGYFKSDADIADGLVLLTNISDKINLQRQFNTPRFKYEQSLNNYHAGVLPRFAENIKELACPENRGNLLKLYCQDGEFANRLDKILVFPKKDMETLCENWQTTENRNVQNYVFDSIITCYRVIDTTDDGNGMEWQEFDFDAPEVIAPQVENVHLPEEENRANEQLLNENNIGNNENNIGNNENIIENNNENDIVNNNEHVNEHENENNPNHTLNANTNNTNVNTNNTNVNTNNTNANINNPNVNTNTNVNNSTSFEAQMARRNRIMERERQEYLNQVRERENDRLSTLENVGKSKDSIGTLRQKQLKAFLLDVSRDISGNSAMKTYEDLQRLTNSLSRFLNPKKPDLMSYEQLQEYYNRYVNILKEMENKPRQFGHNKKLYNEFLGIMGNDLHEMGEELKKAEGLSEEARKKPVINLAKVLERSKSVSVTLNENENHFENGQNGPELRLDGVKVNDIELKGTFVPHDKPFDANYELNELYKSVAGDSEVKKGFVTYLLNGSGGDLSEVKKLQLKQDPACKVNRIHLTFASPDSYRARFDTLILRDVQNYAAKMNYEQGSKDYKELTEVAKNYTKDVLSVDKLIGDMGKVSEIHAKKAECETLGINAHGKEDMRSSAVSMLAGVLGVESAVCKSRNMNIKLGKKTVRGTFTEDHKGILYDESSVDRPELAEITAESLEKSPELIKSVANLQIMDYLTGKTGRDKDSLSIIVGDVRESDGSTKKKVIGVQGIHNENCFGANIKGRSDEMTGGVNLEDCRIIPKETADRISNLSNEAFGAMLMGYGLSKAEVVAATGRLNTLKNTIASARQAGAENNRGGIRIVSEEEMKNLSFRDDLVGMPNGNHSNYFGKLYNRFSSVTNVIDAMLDEIKNTSVSAYYRMGDADAKMTEALSKPEKMGKGTEPEPPAEYVEMEKATRELKQLESRTDRVLFKKASSKGETYYEPNRGFDELYAKSREAVEKADAWVQKLQETVNGMNRENPEYAQKTKELENAKAHRDNLVQLQESYNTLHLMPARFDKYLEIYRKRGEQINRERGVTADRAGNAASANEARSYASNIASVGGALKAQPSVDVADQKVRFIAEVNTFKQCYDEILNELQDAKMRLETEGKKKLSPYTIDGTNEYQNMAVALEGCIQLLKPTRRRENPSLLIEKLKKLGDYAEKYYNERRGLFDRPVRGYGRVRLEQALDLSSKAVVMAKVLERCRKRIREADLFHANSSLEDLVASALLLQDKHNISMKGVPRRTYASEKKLAELQLKTLYKLSNIKPDVYRLYNTKGGIDQCTRLIYDRKYSVAVPARAELYEYYHAANKIFKKGIKPEEAEEIYNQLSTNKLDKKVVELAHNPLFEDVQRAMHRIDNSAGLGIWEKIDFEADNIAASMKSQLDATGPSKEQLIDSICRAGVIERKEIRPERAKRMALERVNEAAAEVFVKKALLSKKGRTVLEYMAMDGKDQMYKDMVNSAKEYFKKNNTFKPTGTETLRRKISNAFDKKMEDKILKNYMDTKKPYPDVKAHIRRVLAERNAGMKAGENKNIRTDAQPSANNSWKK